MDVCRLCRDSPNRELLLYEEQGQNQDNHGDLGKTQGFGYHASLTLFPSRWRQRRSGNLYHTRPYLSNRPLEVGHANLAVARRFVRFIAPTELPDLAGLAWIYRSRRIALPCACGVPCAGLPCDRREVGARHPLQLPTERQKSPLTGAVLHGQRLLGMPRPYNTPAHGGR